MTLAGTHMAGSERFTCLGCGKSIGHAEGIPLGFDFQPGVEPVTREELEEFKRQHFEMLDLLQAVDELSRVVDKHDNPSSMTELVKAIVEIGEANTKLKKLMLIENRRMNNEY